MALDATERDSDVRARGLDLIALRGRQVQRLHGLEKGTPVPRVLGKPQ